MGRGSGFHSPLGQRHLTVITLPAFTSGGTVTITKDGVTTTDTVAANTAYQVLGRNTARRDQTIVATGAAEAEYGFHASLKPGEGWLCQQAGGGNAENFAHVYEVYAVSAAGTTLRIMEG